MKDVFQEIALSRRQNNNADDNMSAYIDYSQLFYKQLSDEIMEKEGSEQESIKATTKRTKPALQKKAAKKHLVKKKTRSWMGEKSKWRSQK